MPQLQEAASRTDAVCAYIDQIVQDVESLKASLEGRLARAKRRGVLAECCDTYTRVLSMRLCQCAAICEVHHDAMDAAGRSSSLFRLASCQDLIENMLDCIELLMAMEA